MYDISFGFTLFWQIMFSNRALSSKLQGHHTAFQACILPTGREFDGSTFCQCLHCYFTDIFAPKNCRHFMEARSDTEPPKPDEPIFCDLWIQSYV